MAPAVPTNGYVEGLKYVFDPQSYARLCAAVSDPFDASDAQVAPFAQQYFQYDSQCRVTLHAVQGAGGADNGGIGTYSFAYSESTAVASDTIDELGVGTTTDPNAWQYKTVETLPDGNQNLYYANGWGEVMLSMFKDISDPGNAGLDGDQWITFYKYDSQGRLIEEAQPSAVTGYDESSPDLLVNEDGSYEYLSNHSGLIELTNYYTQTTATATAPGGAAGYFEDSEIQEGQLGTPVLQETEQYYAVSGSGTTVYPVATQTVYRNSDGTGAETTAYSYTWFWETVQEQSETTTLPVISTAENGSGTAETTATWYNIYGQPTWTMDADGTIDYAAYDPATGAVVKTITDVNTQDTGDFSGLPAGWTTPAGGGLELITSMQVDALGRTVQQTDPDGNVTCTVYNDAAHEVRTYPGWNSTTHTTTGPIEVQREYWPEAGAPTGEQTMYEETLTASATPTYNATTNLPTGQETIDQTNIQSLSRSLLDDAGQVVEADKYFSLAGVTYSTASPYLGTASDDTAAGSYFATLSGYDVEGRSDHVQDPAGNITDTVYDALGRVTSILVGTNDTPGSSNMVDVQDNVYDNGGVGDGDLTQTTLHPGAGQPDRATQYAFDWEDREISSQTGNYGSTTGPISYQVLDNLGQVVAQETFAGDGVTLAELGTTGGVPNPPSSDALCAQTTTEYDDQGRPYQATVAVIDQGSGQITSTQTTEDWYDGRGDLIETLSPAGLATKSQYDGAGRLVMQAETDGGGGTSYAAAGTLNGDVVLSQTQYVYDGDGNTIETIQKTRLASDSSTATGALGDPSTAPQAQVTYATSYFDAAGRDIADVDLGTNGGASYTRPANVPTPSGTVLVTATTYNAAGLAATVTDPLGESTQTAYNMLGEQTAVTNADSSTTSYTYDGAGHILSLTDADANATTWVYQLNQPVQETTPLGTSYSTYDQLGDLLSQTDADGRVTTYSYNSLGQKTAENWLNAQGSPIYTFTYGYDTLGDLTTASDPTGSYTYDSNSLGEATSITQSIAGLTPSVTLTQQFDTAGDRTSVSDNLGGTTTYGYNLVGQMTSVGMTVTGLTASPQVTLGYGNGQSLTSISRYDAGAGGAAYVNTAIGYDTLGRVTSISDTAGSNTLASYNLTWDADSRLTQEVSVDGTENYTYDAVGELTSATGWRNESYSYDATGNRTMTGYQTRTGNELLSDGTYNYTYDNDGNLLTKTQISNSQATQYTWDYRNRLTSVVVKNAQGTVLSTSQYTYDAFNNRIGVSVNNGSGAVQTWTAYDGANPYADFNSSGQVTHRYLYSPAVDAVLADVSTSGTGTTSWELADELGSVRDVASAQGSVIDHIQYDSFGNILSESNPSNGDRFKYAQQQADATGLDYDQARYYNPVTGRFISQDPTGFGGGDVNIYRYCGNLVTTITDPTGTQASVSQNGQQGNGNQSPGGESPGFQVGSNGIYPNVRYGVDYTPSSSSPYWKSVTGDIGYQLGPNGGVFGKVFISTPSGQFGMVWTPGANSPSAGLKVPLPIPLPYLPSPMGNGSYNPVTGNTTVGVGWQFGPGNAGTIGAHIDYNHGHVSPKADFLWPTDWTPKAWWRHETQPSPNSP